ncbi:MAG: serine/threonine-protein kinase [Archangium sp.]|nr:serine/threonine-protein kinase [Archangium sp.]MDP3151090.1 serine/threonine-protein kinase [Archangium sp.]MDP3571774.1 serine/threonine-protein kinase [Archangium sp.]
MSETTRDKVSGDALFILKSLKENVRLGRSNKLADVKMGLENSVSLEFDSYFFFLRKFHYIAMDREAQLKLTDQGDRVTSGEEVERFGGEIADFFAEQITDGQPPPPPLEDEPAYQSSPPAPPIAPPPPLPATDISMESNPMPQPPNRGGRKNQDDGFPQVTAPEVRSSGGYGNPPPPPPAPMQLTAAVQVSSPSGMSSPGTKGQDLDLRYQKNDQLGSGPLGTVYKGKHNALGLDVCVKELKDIFGYFSFLQRGEVIKRLKKELCAQAQVRHPGIVQVLDQNTDVARPYFVMELLKGSLREKLDAAGGKGIPVPHAMRYFLQIAYAMRAAHQQGLTHHNVKPENVLFDAWGNAKIGDFGLGRVIEVDQSKGMPQVFVGTGGMGYMSPELISRSKEAGPSSDVYGLGILLYEMLTGQIPGRRSPLPSEINSDVPSKMDPIFDKMTQDRKDSRYPDFEAVFEDFYSAFADKTYLARGDLLMWSELAS